MNDCPLVSILVISYNQEKLIRETIQSCLAQSYSNLQIVVSDDGSTDSTPGILRDLQDEHPGRLVVVYNTKNSGITRNCNIGLERCEGELIALMGGDDLLLPSKIATQVEAFRKDPRIALSYHPCFVSLNGEIVDKIGHREKDIVRSLQEMIGKFEAQIPGPATMVRRNAIPRYGFNEEIKTASDWLFYIDVSSNGSVSRCDEFLAVYRQHESNVGHRYFEYSDDFIRTIEIAQAKYGHIDGVSKAASRGARRFLLGITYRAMERDQRQLARGYISTLKEYYSPQVCALLQIVTYVPLVDYVMRRTRPFLKKYV